MTFAGFWAPGPSQVSQALQAACPRIPLPLFWIPSGCVRALVPRAQASGSVVDDPRVLLCQAARTLAIDHLFDKACYQRVWAAFGSNYYGEPRNVMVTLRGRF